MKKNDYVKLNDTIYRVLEVDKSNFLVIDCNKKNMPVWKAENELADSVILNSEEAFKILDIQICEEKLTGNDFKQAHERYIKSLKNKSLEDLKKLKALGYNELHVGLETAFDPALAQMNKGFTQKEAYECLEKVKQAGMIWDAIIMTGIAGKGNGKAHIEQTAKLLNKFPPYLLSMMTTSVSTGTPLELMRDNGDFIECTELEKIEEEILLLKLIDFEDCYFFGGHNYNLIPINAPLSRKSEIIKAFEDNIHRIPSHILNGIKKRANI